MKKLLYILIAIFICGIIFWMLPGNITSKASSGEQLKLRLDTAKMITYVDKTYDVEVKYPGFFKVETIEPGTARFSYEIDGGKVFLTMFVEPNVEGWDVHEAVEHLSDSSNTCIEEGENYYIMSGSYGDYSEKSYVEKCFLYDNNWIDFSVYYNTYDKLAVGKLIENVQAWNPKPGLIIEVGKSWDDFEIEA